MSAFQYALEGLAYSLQKVLGFSLLIRKLSFALDGLCFSCRYLLCRLFYRIGSYVRYTRFSFSNHISFMAAPNCNEAPIYHVTGSICYTFSPRLTGDYIGEREPKSVNETDKQINAKI